jgi:predicted nucleic acid-binding protein
MATSPFEYSAVVLDTSVIIKWFRQGEVLASQALVLREAYLNGQITISAPSLLVYELANVLRYKSDLTTSQVQEAVQSLFDMALEWILPSAAVMRRAVEIARIYETTIYDAAFVALAETSSATFITADERLVDRLKTLSFVQFLGQVQEK